MNKFLVAIGLLMAFQVLALKGQTTYHVNGTLGDDTNPGSSALPWKTIQKSMETATPGSVVKIAAGTYTEELVMFVEGTPGNAITFTSDSSGAVVITGGGGPARLLYVRERSHLRFLDLQFTHAAGNNSTGIHIEGACKDIEVRNCLVEGIHFSSSAGDSAFESTNAYPIILLGTDTLTPITDVVISHCTVRNCRTGYSEGIAINGNVDGFEVGHCTVENLTNIGIDAIGHEGTSPNPTLDRARNGRIHHNTVTQCVSPYAWAAGIYVDGAAHVTLENNEVSECQYGIEVGCENLGKTTDDILVRNNVIHHNLITGIIVGGYDYPSVSGKVMGCTLTCNTLHHNNQEVTAFPVGEFTFTYSEGTQVRNNIVSCEGNPAFSVEAAVVGLQLNHNLYHGVTASTLEFNWGPGYTGFAEYQTLTGQDADGLYADPQFLDAALHISSSSAAVDAGEPSYVVAFPETDMDGEVRVAMGRLDIGADETSSTIHVKDPSQGSLLLHPQPADVWLGLQGVPPHATSLEVVNLMGQVELRQAADNRVDVSHLAPGFHLLRLLDAQGTVVAARRFVVH
jgi:hypothetical protein